MATKTIESVASEARQWESQKGGTMASVEVWFAADATQPKSKGEYVGKPNTAQGHIDRLTALIGQPSEFELEARDEYKGIPQWKIKNYPGKPESSGDGKNKGPDWSWKTPEERAEERAISVLGTARQLVADHLAGATFIGDVQQRTDLIATVFPRLLALVKGSAVQGPVQGAPQRGTGQTEKSGGGAGVMGKASAPPSDDNSRGQGPAGLLEAGADSTVPSASDQTEAPAPELTPRDLELARAKENYGSGAGVLKEARRLWPERNFQSLDDVDEDTLIELNIRAERIRG